jgi:hypothetical protein
MSNIDKLKKELTDSKKLLEVPGLPQDELDFLKEEIVDLEKQIADAEGEAAKPENKPKAKPKTASKAKPKVKPAAPAKKEETKAEKEESKAEKAETQAKEVVEQTKAEVEKAIAEGDGKATELSSQWKGIGNFNSAKTLMLMAYTFGTKPMQKEAEEILYNYVKEKVETDSVSAKTKAELQELSAKVLKLIMEENTPKPSETKKPVKVELSSLVLKFMPKQQVAYFKSLKGEEAANNQELIDDVEKQIKEIPSSQEEVEDPIVHLHYFRGGSDWFITENDGEGLLFGFAILNSDYENAELGYISLEELTSSKVELDLYWRIKPLSVAKNKTAPSYWPLEKEKAAKETEKPVSKETPAKSESKSDEEEDETIEVDGVIYSLKKCDEAVAAIHARRKQAAKSGHAYKTKKSATRATANLEQAVGQIADAIPQAKLEKHPKQVIAALKAFSTKMKSAFDELDEVLSPSDITRLKSAFNEIEEVIKGIKEAGIEKKEKGGEMGDANIAVIIVENKNIDKTINDLKEDGYSATIYDKGLNESHIAIKCIDDGVELSKILKEHYGLNIQWFEKNGKQQLIFSKFKNGGLTSSSKKYALTSIVKGGYLVKEGKNYEVSIGHDFESSEDFHNSVKKFDSVDDANDFIEEHGYWALEPCEYIPGTEFSDV